MPDKHISWDESCRLADQAVADAERRRQEANEREVEEMGGVQHGIIRDLRERIAKLENEKDTIAASMKMLERERDEERDEERAASRSLSNTAAAETRRILDGIRDALGQTGDDLLRTPADYAAQVRRERDEARAALSAILTPQLREILTEDPGVPGAVTGGHNPDDIAVVARIGFRPLKRALDTLKGGA